MEEGALAGWRKKDGETVTAGEILFEVESDKAVQEVEALENGILRIPPSSPPLGTHVPVGTFLAWLLAPGEAMPAGKSAAPAAAAAAGAAPAAPRPTPPTTGAPSPAASRSDGKAPAISPRARRVAGELGVEWTGIKGSGRTGRIVERDVRRAVAEGPGQELAAGRPAAAVPGARRVIAEKMSASARTTAAVTLTTEADATELVKLRELFKSNKAPIVPSYNDFLIRIVAIALKDHPAVNGADGPVHVGFAVDTDRALLVPVVRNVQDASLVSIAKESARLVERARAGQLTPDEMTGGTFTITNLGMYEIDAFTPIINIPEHAILGVGRIVAKQVVTDADAGTVAIRRMVVLSLTFDHRMVDGAPAARFLQHVKRAVEQPLYWIAGA
jgi:pyruvate dehydrogenase E2 component (dihydrolipoamide acetyltransferase)